MSWRTAVEQIWRIGLLSFLVSIWWGAGLWAEGAYGLNVLKYTETIPTVVGTSSAAEIWRGLGYWYFYGFDKIQPWTLTAERYIVHALPILLSFALPTIAILTGFVARWRYRAFAVLLIAAGVIFAVSAYPYDHPSPFGAVLKWAADKSTVGLAMRSTNRVLPLVVMGLALLLASGITALSQIRPWYGTSLAALAAVLAAANMAPLYQGTIIASNLDFPNHLPTYVTNAASYLNAQGSSSRVLGIPGVDFGYYRWGVTMDQVWPGLLTRPWVSRGSVPVGEPASANLVRALDTSIQDGLLDPNSLAPMARLMSAGDILLQNDLQFERYDGTHPETLNQQLQPTPVGLGAPVTFGPTVTAKTIVGSINGEAELGIPVTAKPTPSLAVYPVASPRPLIRSEATSHPMLLAGDGEGLLAAADYGLLDDKTPVFYSASLGSRSSFASANAAGSTYVVTDTNAKRLDTFGTLDDTYGFVETLNASMLRPDLSEQQLGMFPASASSATQTIALLKGARSVSATTYGYSTANFPEYQPFNAFDGNPNTAWEAGGLTAPRNEAVQINLTKPVTSSSITLLQPQHGPRNRHITSATVTFDGGSPLVVQLGAASLSQPGQTIHFAPRRFSSLRVTIDTRDGLEHLPVQSQRRGLRQHQHRRRRPAHRDAPAAHRPADEGRCRLRRPPARHPHAPDPLHRALPAPRSRAGATPHGGAAHGQELRRRRSAADRRQRQRPGAQRGAGGPHHLDDPPGPGGPHRPDELVVPAGRRPERLELVGQRRRPDDRLAVGLRHTGGTVAVDDRGQPAHREPPRPARRQRRALTRCPPR